MFNKLRILYADLKACHIYHVYVTQVAILCYFKPTIALDNDWVNLIIFLFWSKVSVLN